LALPVGGPVHDELVGVGGQPIDGGLGEERIAHGGEPFARRLAVGGHDRGRPPVAFDDELVDVGGVGGIEGLEAEVIEGQDIQADEAAHLVVVGAVQAARADAF
jgi:hypothetical protein